MAEQGDRQQNNRVVVTVVLLFMLAFAFFAATFFVAAAIFVPKHFSQTRAEVILEAITVARNGVEAYVKEHRVWPASESDISPGVIKPEVKIVIRKGVIELSIPEEPGKKATISPSIRQGRIVWRCENGGIGPEYLPVGCFQ